MENLGLGYLQKTPFLQIIIPASLSSFFLFRCIVDNRVTRVAWLNRSSILYAGNDKWCLDPRVELIANTKTHYAIRINDVDVYDEGPYTCSVQTDNHPKTSRVHLIVQGKASWWGKVALVLVRPGGKLQMRNPRRGQTPEHDQKPSNKDQRRL